MNHTTQLKQQISKRRYYLAAHRSVVDVLTSNSAKTSQSAAGPRCLGYGLWWAHGTIFGGGPDPPRGTGNFLEGPLNTTAAGRRHYPTSEREVGPTSGRRRADEQTTSIGYDVVPTSITATWRTSY